MNCRAAADLLSQGADRELSFIEKLKLRAHLVMCATCRCYGRQLRVLKRSMAFLARRFCSGELEVAYQLKADSKERMRQALREILR